MSSQPWPKGDDWEVARYKPVASALADTAHVFDKNCEDLYTLTELPTALLAIGNTEVRRMAYVAMGLIRFRPEEPESEDRMRRAHEYATQLLGEEYSPAHAINEGAAMLKKVLDIPLAKAGYDALVRSCVASAWAILESVARDAWIDALNSRPNPLGQRAIGLLPGNAPAEDEISRRHISVGLLARHNFDLRACLGTVLAPKFDFSGVSGIRVAYRVAFEDASHFEAALADPLLQELEATRHVIVHRAGVIDDEFHRRVSTRGSVGSRLQLTEDDARHFVNAAVRVGNRVLQLLDEYLRKTPDIDQHTEET